MLRVLVLGLTVFSLLYNFLVLFFYFILFSPLWLVSHNSYCWLITASRGSCDKRIPSYCSVYITLAL